MEEDLVELRNAVADHQEQLSAVKQILQDQPDNVDAQEVRTGPFYTVESIMCRA